MKLNFKYNKEKDIWCLLNKGKSSNNSSQATKVYEELVEKYGENPDEKTSVFIDEYIEKNNIDIKKFIHNSEKEFYIIFNEFQKIAEKVFKTSLDDEILVYLTVNNRCPYNIQEKWFFISLSSKNSTATVMHELWHFYTWKKFESEEEKIGKEKYNNIKESLTVLLNVECNHLFSANYEDNGYPQHQELRIKILELWEKNPDINYVWNNIKLFLL